MTRDHEAALDAAFYDSLDGALAEAWARLRRGAADRRSGLHTVQLASVGLDGGPRLRTVVLRGAEPEARRLRIHTDGRAAKVAELARDPRVELHAYDAKAKIQLRVRGLARVAVDDAEADAAWAASQPGSRLCYRAVVAPGAAVAEPAEADPTQAMRDAPADAGRENFRAVLIEAVRLEWLYLAARGHRRAVFAWEGGAWRGRWLAP